MVEKFWHRRERILQYIKANGLANFSKIRDNIGTTSPTLRHDLWMLVTGGAVIEKKKGQFKFYYVVGNEKAEAVLKEVYGNGDR